jgi:hypothetical protein
MVDNKELVDALVSSDTFSKALSDIEQQLEVLIAEPVVLKDVTNQVCMGFEYAFATSEMTNTHLPSTISYTILSYHTISCRYCLTFGVGSLPKVSHIDNAKLYAGIAYTLDSLFYSK